MRLPQNKIGTYNRANKAYMAFEQEHEREPSTEELSDILEMSETEINNIFQSNTRHTVALMHLYTKQKMWQWAIYLEGSDDTDEDVMKDSLREEIKRVLKSLSPREAEIVNAYFGLNNDGTTIEQIGMKYDLTKERIRQIKERAIKRLQKARYSNALKAYLGYKDNVVINSW